MELKFTENMSSKEYNELRLSVGWRPITERMSMWRTK